MNAIVTGTIDSTTQKRISRLLSTPIGTMAFDRAFGVDMSFLDDVPAAMEGAALVAYSSAMLEYFPEYTISDISFAVDCNNPHKITPTVVIAANG